MFGTSNSARGAPLTLPGVEAWLDPTFLDSERQSALIAVLREVPWRQETIRLFGRSHPVPRLTWWFADPGVSYTWSGIVQTPNPWPPALDGLRREVEAATGARYNSALANWYRDGRDSMGWHADDEAVLGPDPLIASVSLGATRAFKLRSRATPQETVTVDLPGGSLLFMGRGVQRGWTHAVPRRASAGERFNLTFRWTGPG